MMGYALVMRETSYIHIMYTYMQKTDSWSCILCYPT